MKWGHLIAISFVFLLISFYKKNDLSPQIPILPDISVEPEQSRTRAKKFKVSVNDVDYEIKPLYDYELNGLVVSYKLHDGNMRLHKAWNDHLNVADYCVVWGDTAKAQTLPKINFWNGQFTCNFSTRNREAWSNFDETQISNNHLISDDTLIRDQLSDVRIGDQIRIQGRLAEYTNLNTKGKRGTSITRDDKGNGACETIFVESVQVLSSYSSIWRKLMYASLGVFLFSLFMYFRAPIRYKD